MDFGYAIIDDVSAEQTVSYVRSESSPFSVLML